MPDKIRARKRAKNNKNVLRENVTYVTTVHVVFLACLPLHQVANRFFCFVTLS